MGRFFRSILFAFAVLVAVVLLVPSAGQWVRSQVSPLVLSGLLRSSSSSSSLVHGAAATTGTSILGRSSLSASFINTLFTLAHSPAAGTGQTFYTQSQQTGIDDAYPLAIFWHESNFGRAGVAVATRNPGNVTCPGSSFPCLGNFRLYPTWAVGVQDLYTLLAKVYVSSRHLSTVETIFPVYAPLSDGNSPAAYIASVKSSVALWRSQMKGGQA
jgi:hypothetical protein